MYRNLQLWALKTSDYVVRFTESSVIALEKYYGLAIRDKQIVGVYVSREFEDASHGVDHHQTTGNSTKPAQLLWVGRLVPSKNVDFLLRAAALLRSKSWQLNICSDGPERTRLEMLASRLNLSSRTRFLGAVDDLAAYYRDADLFLTASLLEQYSLTIMEAYSFGVPCIGIRPDWKSSFNSNEDQIVDGKTGYLVTDEREMAERIDYLLDNPDLRREFSINARQMKSSISFESYYQKLKAVLS